MRPRSLALLATALVVAAASGAALLLGEDGDRVAPEPFDAPSMGVGDLDGDGLPELVAHNDDQGLYVVSPRDGRLLVRLETEYPNDWPVRPINSPVVADVDGDGKLDIVAVNSAAVVCVFEHTGGAGPRMQFERTWCSRANEFDRFGAAADGGAWVEDVDGDGKAEIFHQTETFGVFAWEHDGSLRWSRNKTGGNAEPIVSDLDGDGRKDVVFFGDSGEVRVMDASTGESKWAFWASGRTGVKPGSIPSAGAVSDLDGDGKKEVIITARDAHDDVNYSNNNLGLFVVGSGGKLRWMKQPEWGHPMSYTHPIVHDLDGDGRKDILTADWNTIGHKPGDWERLGPGHVFAYDADGELLWMTVVDNSWSNDDLGLADADGDGELEVLANGYGPKGDGVWLLDAATGEKERHIPSPDGGTLLRGPVLGDWDGDGGLDLAVSVHESGRGGWIWTIELSDRCDVVFGGFQVREPCGTEDALEAETEEAEAETERRRVAAEQKRLAQEAQEAEAARKAAEAERRAAEAARLVRVLTLGVRGDDGDLGAFEALLRE